MANKLFTLGLDITATQNRMSKQLKQIAKSLSDSNTVRVTGSLDTTKSQNLIQQQLNSISKNLKINIGNVNIDTSAIKQQQQAINQQLKSGINATGVKVPFQFDLSDANAVKAEINKIVADITNNKGQLVKYKINVDDNGQATKALLTYRNELNEVTNATLKLQSVGKWYDANGVEHSIVKWSEGQKTLSQNIEATVKANQRQMESDNQVIRKKQELIAQMKLLNTQAEKAGISLSSDNQKSFNDLSINASTLDDIKQMESYLRLARTEYQTFNAEIAKGTHASSLETMKNTLASIDDCWETFDKVIVNAEEKPQSIVTRNLKAVKRIVDEGYGYMLKRTCVDQYKKKCFVFYENERIAEIKSEEDAISRAKYEEKHISSRKEMADTRMSELIKKAMEVK